MSWILIPIFAFVLIKHGMDLRAKQQKEKLRLLEEAMRQGQLDEETRREIVDGLSGHRHKKRQHSSPLPAPRPDYHVGFFVKFLVFVGWLAMAVGGAFLIVVANIYDTGLDLPGILLLCIGFGLVTYPFVVRELQSQPRRRTS